MKFLYFTRSNGDVDNLPEKSVVDFKLTTDAKKRDFTGDDGAHSFSLQEPVARPLWDDGAKAYTLDPDNSEEIAAAENALYRSCLAYQIDQIDTNMENEMTKSESLVEAGKATAADLPEAGKAGAWIEALWVEYYTRKADALNASLDFSTVEPVPNDYATIRTERKTFLAGA